MDFELSEAQEQLRDSLRRFLSNEAPLAQVRALLDDPRGHSAGVWKGLAELGLPGLLVPERFGGAQLGMLEMGVALEELGRALYPGPFLSSALAATALLRAAGDPSQHAAYLPALGAGERIACIAVCERGRSDWRDCSTTARRNGGDWRLEGEKLPVADAVAADWLLVVARDAQTREPAAFLTESAAPEIERERLDSVDGTRKEFRVRFANARAERLGSGQSSAAIATALDQTRLGLVADGLGAAQRAFELALAYARERVQFERPIGSFQSVQHLLVDMLQDLELARAGLYYALWTAERATPRECARATAMAKAHAGQVFPRIGADAIQIFGGVGFSWETDVHLYYKRLLSTEHVLGGPREQLEALAALVLDSDG